VNKIWVWQQHGVCGRTLAAASTAGSGARERIDNGIEIYLMKRDNINSVDNNRQRRGIKRTARGIAWKNIGDERGKTATAKALRKYRASSGAEKHQRNIW